MYLCNAFPISKKNTDWNDHFEVDGTSQKGSHMKTAKEWALFSWKSIVWNRTAGAEI